MRKAVAYLLTACLALYGAFLLAHSNIESVHAQGAAPELKSIGPDTIVAGSPTFTLRVEGKNFEDGARAVIDGVPLDSSRVISEKGKALLADVDASVVATPGEHTVQVVNPDGMASPALTLTVVEQDPELQIRLAGNAAEEGEGFDILIDITGEGFEETSRALASGVRAIETTFVSDTQLRVRIAAKFISNFSFLPIQVRNSGGRLSNTEIFFVVPAPADINLVEPNSVEVGTEDFEITVHGTLFKPDAMIMVGGVIIEPTVRKQARLEAIVPGELRQQAGQLIVRVIQNGIQSIDLTLLVSPTTDPFIAALAPSRFRQGETKVVFDIIGANLGNKAVVLIDGEEAKVKRSTRRRLTVVIKEDILSVLGQHSIQVQDEEGNVSQVAQFEVVPDIEVNTLVGGTKDGFNGPGACVTIENALLRRPRRLALGPDGLLYFTDQQNHAIRSLNFQTNEVCTIAGTGLSGYNDSNNPRGVEPTFSNPNGLAVAADGTIYVSENGNNVIRRIRRGEGGNITVDTFAGESRDVPNPDRQKKLNSTRIGIDGFRNGQAFSSAFRLPDDMVIAADGSIYVADPNNHSIRRIRQVGGDVIVETVAGNGVPGFADGEATKARFFSPIALALSLDGNRLFVADMNNNRIRVVDLIAGRVDTLAGNGQGGGDDGPPGESSFRQPIGLALDIDGSLYVSEFGASRIRRVDSQGNVSSVAGDITSKKPRNGSGLEATFKAPRGLAIDRVRRILYVADYENFLIREITLQ